jgi:hypothetical protein
MTMRPRPPRFALRALLLVSTLALASTVAAAPTTPATDGTVMTDKARQLYEEGLAASKKGQLAEARVSFLAAFSLNKHWQIAGNLADSEIQLGKFRDGAEHALYYLRNAPPDRRDRAEALLKLATSKIGVLRVVVDQAGAEVLVGETVVGRAPLAEAVFVEPGKHVVTARFAGRDDATQAVELGAGATKEISIRLIKPIAPPPPTTITPPPPPPPRSIVPGAILAGAGIAALGTGIALFVVGTGKGSDAQTTSEAIVASGNSCVGGAANYDPRCDGLSSTAKSGSAMHNAGVGLLAGGGALGVGALVYFLWPSSTPSSPAQRATRITPIASDRGGALVWSGSF